MQMKKTKMKQCYMLATGAVVSRKPGGYPFPPEHRLGQGVIWRLLAVGLTR
jgi:hypothetical protein